MVQMFLAFCTSESEQRLHNGRCMLRDWRLRIAVWTTMKSLSNHFLRDCAYCAWLVIANMTEENRSYRISWDKRGCVWWQRCGGSVYLVLVNVICNCKYYLISWASPFHHCTFKILPLARQSEPLWVCHCAKHLGSRRSVLVLVEYTFPADSADSGRRWWLSNLHSRHAWPGIFCA